MFEGILQPTHLMLIMAIVLIVFGPGKLPGLGRAVGQSIREFRESTTGGQQEAAIEVEPTKAAE